MVWVVDGHVYYPAEVVWGGEQKTGHCVVIPCYTDKPTIVIVRNCYGSLVEASKKVEETILRDISSLNNKLANLYKDRADHVAKGNG